MSLSTKQPTFDYALFHSLKGADLVEYMEPIVTDPSATVDSADLDRIASETDKYDEYHLVYALIIGAAHYPQIFITHAARSLGRNESSVCCAAFNILNNLPDEFITQDLIETLHQVPVDRKLFTDPINGVSNVVGTNTNFVASLLTKFNKQLNEKQRDLRN